MVRPLTLSFQFSQDPGMLEEAIPHLHSHPLKLFDGLLLISPPWQLKWPVVVDLPWSTCPVIKMLPRVSFHAGFDSVVVFIIPMLSRQPLAKSYLDPLIYSCDFQFVDQWRSTYHLKVMPFHLQVIQNKLLRCDMLNLDACILQTS